ncbi:MAG: hypothetical protein Q9208_008015 [Pyrenodesmia sp. 3 TL-2023]
MASSTESPDTHQVLLASSSTLQVDWSWRKWQSRVSLASEPSKPIYIIHYNFWKSPSMIVKSASSDTTIGTGTLHAISINANYTIHGRKGKLKALKRWRTEYTHLSEAYATGSSPATMRWTSSSSFKTWDFICLDEQQMPVAKFSANWWGITNTANIEFMGPKATSEAARDEIVVTGMTLFYCMVLRINNLGSLFGAIFARPGPIKEGEQGGIGKKMGDETRKDV